MGEGGCWWTRRQEDRLGGRVGFWGKEEGGKSSGTNRPHGGIKSTGEIRS